MEKTLQTDVQLAEIAKGIIDARIAEIGNGMLSHLNTSLQTEYFVSRAKYNSLVNHQYGHNATPKITVQVREYLGAKLYLMNPRGNGFVIAHSEPQRKPGAKNPLAVQWAAHILRLRDSLVEDFEHNGHPEYVLQQADFEQRVNIFYKATFDGRFKNMFRDLMDTVSLRIRFIDGTVVLAKKPVNQFFETQVVRTHAAKIPRNQWAGIIRNAVPRIGERLKHSATHTVVVSHQQFRELVTFWPSEPEFIIQLNKALVKNGHKVEVGKAVVRVSFDKIAQRDYEANKGKRVKKVEKSIAKVFNAQALFAVIDKSFREAMGDISALRWADDYTHTVTLCEYDNNRFDIATVHFVDADVKIGGRNVDELVLQRGDIVLTNDAGAKQFRNAVRCIGGKPNRMCNVRKLHF